MLRLQPLHDGPGLVVLVVVEVEHEGVGRGHVGVRPVGVVLTGLHEVDGVDDLGGVDRHLNVGPVHILSCKVTMVTVSLRVTKH